MNDFITTHPMTGVLAVLVLIIGVGRITRLITYDAFPPSIWWRITWAGWTALPNGENGPWTKLFTCFWCLSPWLTLLGGAAFFLTFAAVWFAWVWWLFLSWMALSYLVAMLVARDDPHD